MEWALPVGLVALLLLVCPLMMVGMVVFGWLFGRRLMGGHGGNSHAGHGMMMCMGHGGSPGGEPGHGSGARGHEPRPETQDGGLLEELKAQRNRLDELIARAEGGR